MKNFIAGKYSYNPIIINRIKLPSLNNFDSQKIPFFKPDKKIIEKFFLSFPNNSLFNNKLSLQRNSKLFLRQESNNNQNANKYNFKKSIVYKPIKIVSNNKQNLLDNQFIINNDANKLSKNSIDILKFINNRNITKRKENNLSKKDAYSNRENNFDTIEERNNIITNQKNLKNLTRCLQITDLKYLESDPKIYIKSKSEIDKTKSNDKFILPKMNFRNLKSTDKKLNNGFIKGDASYDQYNKFNIKNDKSKITIPKLLFNKFKENKDNEIKPNINISIEVKSIPGTHLFRNKLNQDTYLIYPDIKLIDNLEDEHFIQIFGVFDGHGDDGHIISKEIKEYFLEYFNKLNLKESDNYYEKICQNNYQEIYNLFKEIDKKLHEKYSDKDNNICNNSGTTASLIVLFKNKIISINLGHSKSILIDKDNKLIQLNRCHIPELDEEKKRIEENGGEVKRQEWSKEGPERIFHKNDKEKKYSGLSVSRSFGDFSLEQIGVITVPEIKEFDVNYDDIIIMVIGTNGIWEFLTNEKVKDIILPYYDENNISGGINKLINVSKKIWSVKNPMYIDDLSTILLFFNDC